MFDVDSLRRPQRSFLECKPRSAWTWGPDPQLSGELARLRAKDGLMMSGLCTSWHHGSPLCRHMPSVVMLSWELSPVTWFQQDSDRRRARERSANLSRKLDKFYKESSSNAPHWGTLIPSVHVNDTGELCSAQQEWSWVATSPMASWLHLQDKLISCSQLKEHNPNGVPTVTADTLRSTPMPLVLL